jgi:hypothetical protein
VQPCAPRDIRQAGTTPKVKKAHDARAESLPEPTKLSNAPQFRQIA